MRTSGSRCALCSIAVLMLVMVAPTPDSHGGGPGSGGVGALQQPGGGIVVTPPSDGVDGDPGVAGSSNGRPPADVGGAAGTPGAGGLMATATLAFSICGNDASCEAEGINGSDGTHAGDGGDGLGRGDGGTGGGGGGGGGGGAAVAICGSDTDGIPNTAAHAVG